MTKTAPSADSLASQTDRHALYELSVQCPEAEVDFIGDAFLKLKKRKALSLREDFCGTAAVCCEWIRRSSRNTAIGVDLDAAVLEWGKTHQASQLDNSQKRRLTLYNQDVQTVDCAQVDAIVAMNFSYWLFKERKLLKRYFKSTCNALVEDGALFLDAYGGYESFQEIEEQREIDENGQAFTYVWEQERFNPVDNGLICSIHFEFDDGSRIERAFHYDWRLWTLPEIRDLLLECGFSRVTTYWQGFDKDGEGDGDFKPVTQADADAGWICYLVAEK
ncbi:MAG: class I SAM-dependent methyltransferase [Pseudomonadota bacterium]|nr:class I SAM-dependent methyltransferase [Pseudomonadota bacterium]